jgi:hypothetical protein
VLVDVQLPHAATAVARATRLIKWFRSTRPT